MDVGSLAVDCMDWGQEFYGNPIYADALDLNMNHAPELTKIPEGLQPQDELFLQKFHSLDLTTELMNMDTDGLNIDSLDWNKELSGEASFLQPRNSSLVEPKLPKNHRNKLTPPGETVPIHLLFPDPEQLEFHGFIGITTLKQEIDDKQRILRQIIEESQKELLGVPTELEANSCPRQSKLVSAMIDLPLPAIINSSQTLTRSHVKQLQRSVPGRPSSLT